MSRLITVVCSNMQMQIEADICTLLLGLSLDLQLFAAAQAQPLRHPRYAGAAASHGEERRSVDRWAGLGHKTAACPAKRGFQWESRNQMAPLSVGK